MLCIQHDGSTLSIGNDCCLNWDDLQDAVDRAEGVVWDMRGDRRLLPHGLLENALRVYQAHIQLALLGRNVGLPPMRSFIREQTIPLSPSEQQLHQRGPVRHDL